MHYSNTTFGKSSHTLTIRAKHPLPPGVVMGQRQGLSQGDIDKLNALYRCGKVLLSGFFPRIV